MTIDEAILDEIQKRNQPMDRDRALNILQNGLLPQVHGAYHEALDMAIKALEQEPCEDAISRQEVLEEINRIGINAFVTYNDYSGLFDFVDTLPSVTPQPKMGTWIFHKHFDNEHKNCNECIECSQCHTWLGHDCYAKTPYCPMCGAKMKESEDHE